MAPPWTKMRTKTKGTTTTTPIDFNDENSRKWFTEERLSSSRLRSHLHSCKMLNLTQIHLRKARCDGDEVSGFCVMLEDGIISYDSSNYSSESGWHRFGILNTVVLLKSTEWSRSRAKWRGRRFKDDGRKRNSSHNECKANRKHSFHLKRFPTTKVIEAFSSNLKLSLPKAHFHGNLITTERQ